MIPGRNSQSRVRNSVPWGVNRLHPSVPKIPSCVDCTCVVLGRIVQAGLVCLEF